MSGIKTQLPHAQKDILPFHSNTQNKVCQSPKTDFFDFYYKKCRPTG